MLKNVVKIALCALCLQTSLYLNAQEQEQEHEQEAELASKALANLIGDLKTYQADFEQRVNNEFGKELDFSSGTFSIKRPDNFRWEIKESFTQTIVADGKQLWTYDEDLEQVTIQDQNQVLANSPLLLLTSDGTELAESFDISLVTLEKTEDVVESDNLLFLLKPKQTGNVFDSVHILFEDKKLTELLMADTLGQKTSVKFSSVKINEKLDPSLFNFTVPEGVDVVDSREQVIAE